MRHILLIAAFVLLLRVDVWGVSQLLALIGLALMFSVSSAVCSLTAPVGVSEALIAKRRAYPATRSSTSAGMSKLACTSPTSSLSSSASISRIRLDAWDSSIGTRLDGR
jgi:hypothetical protein